jgi:signal transduction histidine kinase
MLASLESSAERQRRFTADAAHELRTPLAGLTAALEVARQHPHIPRDTLDAELLAGHRRLSRTVSDLLVLAALDGRAHQELMPVDLAGVVTDCSRRTVPDGVSLQAGPLEPAVVLGSQTELSRMVTNLVDNALRYADHKVELSVTASRGWARVSVTDDGPGIPEPDRERIWDRFVRLDNHRSQATGGSGLGLAIAREIATAHSGTTSADAALPGPGAEFVILLPLHNADSKVRDPNGHMGTWAHGQVTASSTQWDIDPFFKTAGDSMPGPGTRPCRNPMVSDVPGLPPLDGPSVPYGWSWPERPAGGTHHQHRAHNGRTVAPSGRVQCGR